MKTLLNLTLAIAFIVLANTQLMAQENQLTDSRDGKTYKVLYIGNQVWMGENLNFEAENSWIYADKKKNGTQFGRLYSYEAAINACPNGWHLPNNKEWQELINHYGGDLEAGKSLRIDGTSSFNAEYAGFRTKDGEFVDMGHDANFWTATSCDDEDAWRCYIDRGFNSVVQDYFSKSGGLSVRCIKDFGNSQQTASK